MFMVEKAGRDEESKTTLVRMADLEDHVNALRIEDVPRAQPVQWRL